MCVNDLLDVLLQALEEVDPPGLVQQSSHTIPQLSRIGQHIACCATAQYRGLQCTSFEQEEEEEMLKREEERMAHTHNVGK